MARTARTAAPAAPAAPPGPVLTRALLRWFARARRTLPWRERYDPYTVWVSEMMLQQTQVETVLPYYARWLERFPTVAAVAQAPLEAVLKAWEGLGYYARARNLHRAARVIQERFGGRVPDGLDDLLSLPGVGCYTAGAIASIGYNRPVPLVDGNVGRVLGRLLALEHPARSPAGQRALWRHAQALLPPRRARDFNQALMELGALVCRPKAPDCPACPVRGQCRARALGDPARYPPRSVKRARPVRRGVLLLLRRGARLLLRQRPASGLWGGLWEFPWAECAPGEAPAEAARRLAESLPGRAPSQAALRPAHVGAVSHALTHFQLELECYAADRGRGSPTAAPGHFWRWVTRRELAALPLARPNHKALALLK
jgi:A/G-specific adenine glycosylase